MAISLFDLGMVILGIVLVISFFGERPVLQRVIHRLRGHRSAEERDLEQDQGQNTDVAAAA